MMSLLKLAARVCVLFSPLSPVVMLPAQVAASSPTPLAGVHVTPHPMITGSDGSVTGLAKFQGNFTVIGAPSGQALAIEREPDCSLTMVTGTYSSSTPFTYAATGLISNYERVLHTRAGLTTTPGVFSAGCVSPTRGVGSHEAVFAGVTTSGISVYAATGYAPATGGNGLYVVAGITNFTTNVFSFNTAGPLTTADLNGDGNGNLVVVNNFGTTSGQITVLLGNPDGTFQTGISYPTAGTLSLSAVIDDVNGDGKLDIVASSDDGHISVLAGRGDGTFGAAQSFAVSAPSYPGSILASSSTLTNLITADLRGTGKRDIIASNGLVLLGNNDGTFTAAASAAFPPLQASSSFGVNLASGDLNRDGKMDLVVSSDGNILTYLGKGDGSFSPGASYATVNTDGFVQVTDLDGDGNPDIYIGGGNGGFFYADGEDANLAYALMGNGDGSFHGAPTAPGVFTGHNLGDVNGDGQLDLITPAVGPSNLTLTPFTISLGTSKGLFNPVGTISPPTTFSSSGATYTTGTSVGTYFVADINGDGKADLVFVLADLSASDNGRFFFTSLSKGDGTFAVPVAHAIPSIAPSGFNDSSFVIDGLQVADFDGDGHQDLLFSFSGAAGSSTSSSYYQGFVVLPGNGDATFKAPVTTFNYNGSTAPPYAQQAEVGNVADVNGDGKPDLLVISSTGGAATGFGTQVQLYLGKGDGSFLAPSVVSTAVHPAHLAVADLNKDGKLDLIATGETTTSQGQLSVSMGNGDGTFATPAILTVAGGDVARSANLAVGDFDGDGNMDLATVGVSLSGIYYGKGDGTFSAVDNGNSFPKDLIDLQTFGSAIAVDLNNDGKPDLLSGNVVLLNINGSAPGVVVQGSTATALSVTPITIAQGGSVTLTANVSVSSGTGTPAGSVTFADGETIFGTAALDGTGKAAMTTSALKTGVHSLTAAYGGSDNFIGSISAVSTLTVGPAAAGIVTTTSLMASGTSVASGTSITFTATVSPASGTAVPVGTISFTDAGTAIGSATLDGTGKASFAISTLAVGSHSIVATYGGETTPATFANSASTALAITVTSIPVVATATTLTASPTSASAGTSIMFTAVVTPSSGTIIPTGTVTFSDGTSVLGTGALDTTGKATLSTAVLAVGFHTITAAYGGATGSTIFSTSTSIGVTVVIAAATTPDFSIALSPAASTVTHGTGAMSTLTLTPLMGFKAGATITCTGAPANSVCMLASSTLTTSDGTTAVTTTVTLQTSVQTAALVRDEGNISMAAILPLGLLSSAIIFGLMRRRTLDRKRNCWPICLLAFCAMATILGTSGCGHSSTAATTTTSSPSAGTYPLTITATSGTTIHTATFTVTIQ